MSAAANRARIFELRAQGLTTAVISDRTGVHISSVKNILAEAQFGRITPEKGEQIETLRRLDHTQTAIAEMLNLSQSQVSEYLKEKSRARFTAGHITPIAVSEPITQRREWKPSKTLMEQYARAASYRLIPSLHDD
jgi:predicted transcriptional regulator